LALIGLLLPEGGLYFAIVADLFSRRIVGWATCKRMKTDLVATALKRALATRTSVNGPIHHSDRNPQYCSDAYQPLLIKQNITLYMSGKGNCFDNSMVETVFKTIKSERTQSAVKKSSRLSQGFQRPTE